MELLNKSIKKLSDDEYRQMLKELSISEKSKPYQVLEIARKHDYEDPQMIQLLGVNPSAYYTLKSRLVQKVANYLSKEVNNPISVLMEEVARVPAYHFASNRRVAIIALKDLEKQLLEYDLSNELIGVYKTLARLKKYKEDHAHYEKLYNRHVAFSLAVEKAENLLYDYFLQSGSFLLTGNQEELEEILVILREMANLHQLYDSHRMFVIHSVIKTYHLCSDPGKKDSLFVHELEVEKTLQEMQAIFQKYNLDTFYQHMKYLINLLYFEYYQRNGNQIRTDHYFSLVLKEMPQYADCFFFAYPISRFLNSAIEKFLEDRDWQDLNRIMEILGPVYEPDPDEIFHAITWYRFKAVAKIYNHQYAEAAYILNELRNNLPTKQYIKADIEVKLFQAYAYMMVPEEALCLRMVNSVKRQVSSHPEKFKQVEPFIKLIKSLLKNGADINPRRFKELNTRFLELNKGADQILWFLQPDIVRPGAPSDKR